jgi:hypothetical protein
MSLGLAMRATPSSARIHDDAALEHLGEAEFEAKTGGAEVSGLVAVLGVVCHEVCPSAPRDNVARNQRPRKLLRTSSLAVLDA